MLEDVVRYDLIFHLCFEVSGKTLSPKIVNPLIGDFHDKLDNFYYESYPIKIRPALIDSFMFKEIDSSKVIGSWQIKWDIIDIVKGGAMFRKNNLIKPLLTRLVKKIGVEIGMKDFKIIMRIINTRFQDDFKEGVWPDSDIQSTAL